MMEFGDRYFMHTPQSGGELCPVNTEFGLTPRSQRQDQKWIQSFYI